MLVRQDAGNASIIASDFVPGPINLGSSETASINQFIPLVAEIAGAAVERRYNLDARKGVTGRNSDNTLILEPLGWEPSVPIRIGMGRTSRTDGFKTRSGADRPKTRPSIQHEILRASFRHRLRSLPRFGLTPQGDGLVLLALTLLVWGLYPFSRGIRFAGDDVNFLFSAWQHAGEPFARQLLAKYPVDGWTRALAFWPFVVATNTPSPVVFLQSFYGVVWLLNGVAVAHLARVLWPASRLAPLIGGCLMVTATSDFLTDSVVYAPHLLGVALFFFGTAQLLRSAEMEHGVGRPVTAVLLLSWSFFTVEYTYPAVPLLPVLVWLHARPGWSLRWWRAVAVVVLAFFPAALILALNLLKPESHATLVLTPDCAVPPHCSLPKWLWLLAKHIAFNVWPIGWAFRPIPPWYNNYAPVFPPFLCAGAAAFGALLASWRFRHYSRQRGEGAGASFSHFGLLAVFAFVAVVAVNAVLANPGGDYFVRSHFVSRGWTSLGLALLMGAAARIPRFRVLVGSVFAVFVFFGVWGGVERQSYLLGYAINERRELVSLLETVPGFAPPSFLVVIQPPGSPSLIASNNPNTIPFLYGDVALWNHVVMAPNSAFDYSTVEGDGAGRIRILSNSKRERLVDPASCIIIFYSSSQGRFIRFDEIPAGLLRGSERVFTSYAPARLLLDRRDRVPRAVGEFLAHGGFDSSERPIRKSRQRGAILSVPAAFANDVQADSLTPYTLAARGTKQVAELGSGRARGYSSLLWARAPTAATLSISIAPGSGHALAERDLVVRLTHADGGESMATRLLPIRNPIKAAIRLGPGKNILEIWLDEDGKSTDTEGKQVSPIGWIEQMGLEMEASSASRRAYSAVAVEPNRGVGEAWASSSAGTFPPRRTPCSWRRWGCDEVRP